MKTLVPALALALALLPADIAMAKEKGGKGKSGAKGHASAKFKAKGKAKSKARASVVTGAVGGLAVIAGTDTVIRLIADCPPGLAKKDPPCIPPGQARKSDDIRDGDHDHVAGVQPHDDDAATDTDTAILQTVGAILTGQPLIISDFQDYVFDRPAPGEAWYRVGDGVYRVNRQTRTILEVLALTDALTG